MRATYPVYLILPEFIALISGEAHKL